MVQKPVTDITVASSIFYIQSVVILYIDIKITQSQTKPTVTKSINIHN